MPVTRVEARCNECKTRPAVVEGKCMPCWNLCRAFGKGREEQFDRELREWLDGDVPSASEDAPNPG